MRRLIAAVAAMATLAVAQTAAAAPSDPIGELIQRLDSVASAALRAPQWLMKATLYHAGGRGIRNRDSMGCKVEPMRTLAVDPKVVPLGSVVYIKETEGLVMPDGRLHDGLWYASDIGGAIKGQRIDLFTGSGSVSMRPLQALNMHALSVTPVSTFQGCPPS